MEEKIPSTNPLGYDTYIFGDVIQQYGEFESAFLESSANFSRAAEQQGHNPLEFKSRTEVPLNIAPFYNAREARLYEFLQFIGDNWRVLDHYRLSKKLLQDEEQLRKMVLEETIVDQNSGNTVQNPNVPKEMIEMKKQEIDDINQTLQTLYNEIQLQGRDSDIR